MVIHSAIMLAMLTVSAGANDLGGQALDAEGRPIPKASVFIYTARPRVGQGAICPGCYADCRKSATTDAEGKFVIGDLDRGLLFRVLVVAEGFRPRFAENVDPHGGALAVKLEPMPTDFVGRAVLRGRVLDRKGKPVVGAVVSPRECKTADRQWGGQVDGADAACVTNLRGEFVITGPVEHLAYALEIDAKGFARNNVELLPTDGEVHEIRMSEGASLHGRVLKDGKPLSGLIVSLIQCDTGPGNYIGYRTTATDAEGRYRFANLATNDEYFVFLSMKQAGGLGKMMAPKRVSVGAEGTDADAGDGTVLEPIYRVSGRIILTDGRPIPKNTRLWLSREEIGWDAAVCVLGQDGSFSFSGVPEEAVALGVRVVGYRLASQKNRFQQIRSTHVAVMVDGDKSGLEIYMEPDPTAKPGPVGR